MSYPSLRIRALRGCGIVHNSFPLLIWHKLDTENGLLDLTAVYDGSNARRHIRLHPPISSKPASSENKLQTVKDYCICYCIYLLASKVGGYLKVGRYLGKSRWVEGT